MNLLGFHVPGTQRLNFAEAPVQESLPTEEQAWSEDAIFQMGARRKYNPDDLIGKKGHGIYRRMMLDEQVKAVVKFKRDAITSREFIFEADTNELGDEEAARRVALCESIVKQMKGTFIDALNGIMSATWQGVSYSEKNFTQIQHDNKAYWGIDTIKLKPFDTFEFEVDDFGNVDKFVQDITGRRQELDINKFIHHVQNPEYDAQYGQSDLREAYRATFSKEMAYNFYNMFLERSASGFKWINTKALKGTPAYAALQNVLSNSVNGAGMLLGKDDEFNVEFPSSKGEAFEKAIDKHDLGIARALLVPNLMGITPSGQTGSFSQSDTQLEAFLWTLDQEAKRLEEVLNEQLFRELGEINFGDDYWPRIKFQPISEKRKIAVITLWNNLVTSGGVKHSESDESHIRELLEFPEKDEDTADGNDDVDDGNATDDDDGRGVDNGNRGSGETIKGSVTALYAKQRFTKAMARVDFRVIQRASETMEQSRAEDVGAITKAMTDDAVNQVREFYAKDELDEQQLKIKFDRKDKAKLQRTINGALQDSWKLGQRHAENEIDKAQGLAFSLKVDRDRLKFISEDFFKIKSFKVAGKLSDDLIAVISQVISNGVKGGKTFKTIEQDIYLAVGGAGFLTMEDYRAALGSAIDPNMKNTQHRIDTMLRTNGFEAINEARFSYFTDPQLNGFVEALEYSAIMDSRTTQVCFVGETPVMPLGKLENMFRRNYSGNIITITTSSGKKIAGTPNHPILTSSGWLPLNEIEPDKHVVYSPVFDVVRITGDNNIGVPPTVAELYDSINKPVITNIQRESSSAQDFHGDGEGGDGEVDVLSTYGELRYTIEASFINFVKNKLLRGIHFAISLYGSGSIANHFMRWLPIIKPSEFNTGTLKYAENCRFTSPESGHKLGWSSPLIKHVNNAINFMFRRDVVFAAPSRMHNASAFKHACDGCSGDAVFSSQTSGRLPVTVATDNVISKIVEFRSCHVYNLHTSLGLYIAGGLVVKNCQHLDGKTYSTGSPEWERVRPPNHHNCRSLLIPVTQIDVWTESDEPTIQPQKGFA